MTEHNHRDLLVLQVSEIVEIKDDTLNIACEQIAETLRPMRDELRLAVITDDAAYTSAGALIKAIKALFKTADDRRRVLKAPFAERVKEIDNAFGKIASVLVDSESALRAAMQRRAADIEREREQQQREQDAAIERAAERAAERGDTQKAEEILQRGSELEIKKTPAKTDAATVSHRKVIDRIEIVDFAAVPDQYKRLDEQEVRKAWVFREGALEIKGLILHTRQQVIVR